MKTQATYSTDGVQITVASDRGGLFGRLLPQKMADLDALPPSEQPLAFAIADLRAMADEMGESLLIESDTISLSHRLAAAVDGETGSVLGLPPLTDLTMRTDAEGVLGTATFRLRVDWLRGGQVRTPRRTGAILETDRGPQRLPLWMLDALAVAETYRAGTDDAVQWEALARFRKALEPGVELSGDRTAARVSMTDFLSGLEVTLADRFSISPDTQGNDFSVVPFAADRLEAEGGAPSESMSELADANLREFQRKFRERGALAAYRLGRGQFMVVDRSASPALRVMAEMQRAPLEERRAFIRNPRARITSAVEEAMRSDASFSALAPSAQEEMVEAAAGPAFVETTEFMRFSERVTGTTLYTGNLVNTFEGSGTTWMPEMFPEAVLQRLDKMTLDELQGLRDEVAKAVLTGARSVKVEGETIPATSETLQVLDGRIEERRSEVLEKVEDDAAETDEPSGKLVLETADNFEEVHWRPSHPPRHTAQPVVVPPTIKTALKPHQLDSLAWQIEAWKTGLPGILNADEQGLGKTLQTIAFLVWLNEHMKRQAGAKRGPILVVAPTSLLENWEQEVTRHVAAPGLGHLVRLYGSATSVRRKTGARGQDTEVGEALLDFTDIEIALQAGAGHLT